MIGITNPTGRSTEARRVDIGPHSLFFSYETLIAYSGPSGNERVENIWGQTTGRHINEMGLRDWPVTTSSDSVFAKEVMEKIFPDYFNSKKT